MFELKKTVYQLQTLIALVFILKDILVKLPFVILQTNGPWRSPTETILRTKCYYSLLCVLCLPVLFLLFVLIAIIWHTSD